jgi:hypothetical protein
LNSFDRYSGCWHGIDEVHTKDCAYDLVRIEVIVGLLEKFPNQKHGAPYWNPKTVKHVFTFKNAHKKAEEA